MKVLVTGSAGLLGRDVLRQLEGRRGMECIGADKEDFDLLDASAVRSYIENAAPDAIVHCAGYTQVDKAESQPEVCAAVNGLGTVHLLRAAGAVGAKVVYISSAFVFPGTGEAPWQEDAAYGPVNVYGMSKVQGEDAVRSLTNHYFILRTGLLFGSHGPNFVRDLPELCREKSEIRLPADQFCSPSYTRDVARVIGDMIVTEKYGIYHVRNEGFFSMAELAKTVMKKSGLRGRVLPVPSEEIPAPAKRPLNARLASVRLEAAGFRPMPDAESALDRFLEEMKKN